VESVGGMTMNIIMYGAGSLAWRYLNTVVPKNGYNVVAIVDSDVVKQGTIFQHNTTQHNTTQHNTTQQYTILPPEQIPTLSFDKVMITVVNDSQQIEIIAKLCSLGVPANKIKTVYAPTDHEYPQILAEHGTLDDIPGDIAECGVYKGDFAVKLNTYFPERRLWLFDTFEGFAEQDETIEQSLNLNYLHQNLSDTSLEYVRSRLPHPNNAVFRKGWFPETAKDVDMPFAFVRLDMDLYQPIFEGLKLFWPLMSEGGLILVDDYGCITYPLVTKAVSDFEALLGKSIPKCPITHRESILLIKS